MKKNNKKTKKIVVWIAVIAIILSFLAPMFIFVLDNSQAQNIDINTPQSPTSQE